MALAPCRECAREVSTDAKTCPYCGIGLPAVRVEDAMWKSAGALLMLFVAAMAFVLFFL
jgi:hypothetical protein